jgi:hypothetical protein
VSIPRETSKELVVTVENESLVVAISPPILDAVIVAGKAPEQNSETMLFADYNSTSDTLTIKTAAGRIFVINNAVEVT